MLLGQYSSVLGAKNRIAIPKRFRSELGGKLIVARWYEGCLVMVSEKMWENLISKLTGRIDMATQPVRDTDRFIMGSAFECDPDAQGRVVLSKVLTDYASLKADVVFLGLGEKVEIWDQSKWLEKEEKIAKEAAGYIEDLAKTG